MSACNGQAILEAQPAITLAQFTERMTPYDARVAELQRRYPHKRGALLQLLWLVQEEWGWVPRIGIKWAAERADVSPVHAFGVVEFYTMYRQAPVGRHFIQVCHNVSCHIQGAEDLIAHLEAKLGIHAGETTEDGLFTLVRVECLAMCGNGPGVLIDDEFLYGPGELNEQEEGWTPRAEDLDRWIDRLRQAAGGDPQPRKVDALGGIMLDTKGHPGAAGATADMLPPDYAPPPPALKVKASSAGEEITVECLCAPEVTVASVERSDDGQQWHAVGEVDVTAAPGVPGPPGGPKQVSFTDRLAIGQRAHYRFVAVEGERRAKPSASAVVTAEPEPESADDGSNGKEQG